MPQPMHTMRGPKVGTATSPGQRSALSTAWWWQFQQDTKSDRTPSSRMLPSVIGSIGWSKQEAIWAMLAGAKRPAAISKGRPRSNDGTGAFEDRDSCLVEPLVRDPEGTAYRGLPA
jgi:hypothetical protein